MELRNGPLTKSLSPTNNPTNRKSVWKWIIRIALVSTITLVVIVEIVLQRAGPILKGRVIETLSTRFNSRVEMDGFRVSLLHGLEVAGNRLQIYPPDSVVAAGARDPLIAIDHFSFHAALWGLFFKPMHVGTVSVSGLHIHIPPREIRQRVPEKPQKHGNKIKIVVDKIICDNSQLIIGTIKPDKDPKDFELKHIDMRNVGPNEPWRYEATLTNAVPRGEIHANGTFGPWQTESPGDSSVTGRYTFDHADLNTIKGIGGILSSTGKFKGQLDRIDVEGITETPDFSIDTTNHPVPLHTEFHAIVDGISGDTYLQPVNARLGESRFTTRGAVISVKGQGHRVDLQVDVPNCRIQDFLALAVKTQPPLMTGVITTKADLHIRPGKESVSKKLNLKGQFSLRNIRFSNPDVQDKVDMLSLRAKGEPERARPGAPEVSSQMTGSFLMGEGVLRFPSLAYHLPGGQLTLAGIYSLDGQQFDFRGNVRTNASLSEMVSTWWKSWLLKPVSPFFKGRNGGADIPITISGTRAKPKFGLDVLKRGSSQKSSSTQSKQRDSSG